MRAARLVRLEETGAFQHDVHALLAMRQFAGLALAGHGDRLAVHDDRVVAHFDSAGEAPVRRIVLKQDRVRFRIRQIVDADEIQIMVVALENGARHEAADTSETVDCNLGRHWKELLLKRSVYS